MARADSGEFYAAGIYFLPDSTGTPTLSYELLLRCDSLGNVRWVRTAREQTGRRIERLLALPDGFLSVGFTGAQLQGGITDRAEVRRFDGAGIVRWTRTYGYLTYGRDLTALPDGAYAMLADAVDRHPPPYNYWSFDHRLLKFSSAGDSLQSVYIGDSAAAEGASRVRATTDGGLVLVGRQAVQPATLPRRGILFKLNAAWQEQWRYWFAPPTGAFDRGGVLYDVHELANGHFLATGLERIQGQVVEVASPGTASWVWNPPPAAGGIVPTGRELLPDLNTGAWQIVGNGSNQAPGMGQQDIWLAQLGNLPAAATVNLCATPPGPPVATFQAAGAPGTLRFTLDVAATSAGPPYAEISRVTWQWGDGTPADTGRAVTHVFTSPQPVRVRCTITNNLFCTSTTNLFPFGLLGVRQEAAEWAAAVSIYPNPSATGHFTVATPATAAAGTYAVVDATGRRVATGALSGPQTALDLRPHPAGVYALRLTWPEGHTLTRKLIRWE